MYIATCTRSNKGPRRQRSVNRFTMVVAHAGAAYKLWRTSKPLRRRVLALREMHRAGEDVGFSECFDDLSVLERQAKKIKKGRKTEKKRLKKQRRKQAKMEKKLQKQRKRGRGRRRRRRARTRRRTRGNAHRRQSRRSSYAMREGIEDPYMSPQMKGSRSQAEESPKSKIWKKLNELVDDLFGESSQHETHYRSRRS